MLAVCRDNSERYGVSSRLVRFEATVGTALQIETRISLIVRVITCAVAPSAAIRTGHCFVG